MADSRPKRANAGKNIGKLVNQELGGDDFYSTAYGGFLEESEDEEYETEDSEDDQVDSDFDVDESGWGPDDEAETKIQKEEKEKKKKQWIKPYKAPTSSKPPSQPKKPRPKTTLIVTSLDAPTKTTPAMEPRVLRKSTQEISRGFRRRQEEEEEQRRKRKVRRPKQVRRLTQQELLEEAKYTEIENLASLEAYYKMEAEKKKVKEKKVLSWSGPAIRYLSLTMPVVEEVGAKEGTAESAEGGARAGESVGGTNKIEVLSSSRSDVTSSEPAVPMETDASQNSSASADSAPKVATSTLTSNPNAASTSSEMTSPNTATPINQESATATNDSNALKSATPTLETQQPSEQKQSKQCRNFLVFTDTAHFPSAYFPPCSSARPQKRRRRFCPVTGLPAKYIDPLTHTPYATPFAFKVIRLRYASEAEEKCEKRLAQLSNWLEEKKKRKKMESV